MKEVQINGVEYLLVESPKHARKFSKAEFGELVYLSIGWRFLCNLPHGNYDIIGKASKLAEQEWQQIVESEFDTWLNYLEDEKLGSYYLTTAKESGYSLLELHGFKPETTLILKRKA